MFISPAMFVNLCIKESSVLFVIIYFPDGGHTLVTHIPPTQQAVQTVVTTVLLGLALGLEGG